MIGLTGLGAVASYRHLQDLHKRQLLSLTAPAEHLIPLDHCANTQA